MWFKARQLLLRTANSAQDIPNSHFGEEKTVRDIEGVALCLYVDGRPKSLAENKLKPDQTFVYAEVPGVQPSKPM